MADTDKDRPERFNVLGVGVSAIDQRAAVARILRALEQGEKGYVSVTGVHGVSEAQADPSFKRVLNRSLLVTPDGMPLVWLGRVHHHAGVDRVYGPDLMLALCEATRDGRHSHFFYGGQEGVAEELARRLQARFQGLRVVGHHCPPFRPLTAAEDAALIEKVARARPSILWVGLSTPKQERFMHAYLPRLETGVMLGVGAAFDFHTGRVRQAPRFVQRSGMEWLFRLAQDPKRLWRRYLKNNPSFVVRTALQLSGLRRYPLE